LVYPILNITSLKKNTSKRSLTFPHIFLSLREQCLSKVIHPSKNTIAFNRLPFISHGISEHTRLHLHWKCKQTSALKYFIFQNLLWSRPFHVVCLACWFTENTAHVPLFSATPLAERRESERGRERERERETWDQCWRKLVRRVCILIVGLVCQCSLNM